MDTNIQILLLLLVLCLIISHHEVHAFGAGNIASFAYLEGRAFRHGDIEDVLGDIAKKAAGGFSIGALVGKGGSKFGGLDIKRVYFGNWLRDYSQAIDKAGLEKLPLQTIMNLCMVLGFLAHGYATAEFEVTEERLGVYLPTEHIDNPKGYCDGEDARKYHPKLRGPVDPRELEVDPRTGMKNYIANESGNWDTSRALVKRLLQQCVQKGRQYRSSGRKEDEYEAYRLLGTLLHTLEDFPAHSNFCELALINMGHHDVFAHVGDSVRIHAPNGKSVAPLVTGTFGGADFFHSLLGEATDHISSASVSDLNKEFDTAMARSRSGPGGGSSPADTLRDLLFKLPGGTGGSEMSRDMDNMERLRAGPAKPADQMSPQEMHAVLWQVLTFRDNLVKRISATIEKIPGLGPLIEKLMDSIAVFIFTTLEPYVKPLLKTASSGLMSASSEVINSHDQYEVFNDPRASDPTHSFLSKDHFNLILNEPAGLLAKVIVTQTASRVVKAWDDNSVDIRHMSEEVLECLFHPDFHNGNSHIQREMMQCMKDWAQRLGNNQRSVIGRLNKSAVRNHENIRGKGEGGVPEAQGTASYDAGINAQHNIQGYLNNIPGVSQAQNLLGHFSPHAGAPPGFRREGPTGGSSYPGMSSSGGYTGPSAPPPNMGGEASSYYASNPSGGGSSFAPPSGAPPSGMPGGTSSFPGGPGGFPAPPAREGYSPSYGGPPQGTLGGGMGFPSADAPPMGGFPSPMGPPPGGFAPPGGPGGFGFPSPSGAPPAFPGGPGDHPFGPPGHQHHQHQQHHAHPSQYPGGYRP